jgi:hypothetical protein
VRPDGSYLCYWIVNGKKRTASFRQERLLPYDATNARLSGLMGSFGVFGLAEGAEVLLCVPF